jgi:hypothetical protein
MSDIAWNPASARREHAPSRGRPNRVDLPKPIEETASDMVWRKERSHGFVSDWRTKNPEGPERRQDLHMPLGNWTARLRYAVLLCVGMAGCEHVDEITPRAYVGMLVADMLPQRDQIAGDLLSGKPVSAAGPLVFGPAKPGAVATPVEFGWVTVGGAVVTYSKKYGVTVIQEPAVVGGAVNWSCVVYPMEAKPKACRAE